MPGETTACIGCHERRTEAPPEQLADLAALARAPSRIEPIADVPDVIDYPRDIQPIWDRHCTRCHSEERRDGDLSLAGDHGPVYSISYFEIIVRSLVVDPRHGSDRPRSSGSVASRLMKFLNDTHYNVAVSERERKLVRLWIDTGATYPGTYAALGSGMIGQYVENHIDRSDTKWPNMIASMEMKRYGVLPPERPDDAPIDVYATDRAYWRSF